MKKEKNQARKLMLNKQVISVLTEANLRIAKGGKEQFHLQSETKAGYANCTGRPTTTTILSFLLCENQE